MKITTNNTKISLINHVIKIAKRNHYEEQLVKYKYDTKLLWKTLNHKHEKNRSIPKELTGNSPEEKNSDPQTIANKLRSTNIL